MKPLRVLLSAVVATAMAFGFSPSTAQGQCPADLNGDGQINQADVAQLLANSGPVPFPTPVVPTWATLLEASPDPAVVTDANLRAAIVASGFAWRIKDTSSDIEMFLVPAGTFIMGDLGIGDNQPHQVTLTNAFYMGKTEVTQAQWQAKMGSNPSAFFGYSDSPSLPVENVSWNSCNTFCTLSGFRLPTENEWEYACRAGTTTESYGVLNDVAWWSGNNSPNRTKPVATKLPNGFGLCDTIGNVMEFCQDSYDGVERVFRGGMWNSGAVDCHPSHRFRCLPDSTDNYIGFRVARNP